MKVGWDEQIGLMEKCGRDSARWVWVSVGGCVGGGSEQIIWRHRAVSVGGCEWVCRWGEVNGSLGRMEDYGHGCAG